MRIVGRSESPSFPSLETLPPMEKSWALEVEEEEETLFLQARSEHLHTGTASVKQTETSWVSCKRLNSGSKEASHRSCARENEHYSKRASRSFDSKPYRNDQHHDPSKPLKETKRAWQFKCSSRCYPPSVNIRSSDFSVSSEERASRLQTQRGMHELRKFARPDRTSDSFVSRQHFIGSKKDFSRESQGVKASVNTLKRRQDHLACSDHRRRGTASVYEASRRPNDHGYDRFHLQGHQEPDESKHEFQPWFDKHRQYRHGQYHVKSEFSEHRSRCWSVRKMEHQTLCHGLADQKNAKHRSDESEKKQHIKTSLAGQNLEEKPHIIDGESVTSDAATTAENALPEAVNMFESSCTEESEVKLDDSIAGKEQYEMLACLLFDDLQDLDEDSDVACVDEGPGCEYNGSVFDNEPEVNMDIDDVREVKDVSGKPSAACTTKHSDCNFSGMVSVVKSAAMQHSKTYQDGHALLGLKNSPPVLVDVTNKFEIHTSAGGKGEAQEDDAHRLSQRQRQVDFGKNTLGYERYTELVPRFKRKAKDPQTPNPKQVCSKRSWDGQIRKWRRLLHVYDPPREDGEEIAEDFSILKLKQSNLQNDPDAKQDTSSELRIIEADESKGRTKNVGDASLTIYEDWMES